jgi:hypothetical protein
MRLTTEQLGQRLQYDYLIMQRTQWNGLLRFTAYPNARDLTKGTHAILDHGASVQARHYLVEFAVTTLEGPNKYSDRTLVHFDLLAGGNYPFSEPLAMVVSEPVPWSPH